METALLPHRILLYIISHTGATLFHSRLRHLHPTIPAALHICVPSGNVILLS